MKWITFLGFLGIAGMFSYLEMIWPTGFALYLAGTVFGYELRIWETT